jgi:hypothetical protein
VPLKGACSTETGGIDCGRLLDVGETACIALAASGFGGGELDARA